MTEEWNIVTDIRIIKPLIKKGLVYEFLLNGLRPNIYSYTAPKQFENNGWVYREYYLESRPSYPILIRKKI